MPQDFIDCPECGGTGKEPPPGHRQCPECDGAKRVSMAPASRAARALVRHVGIGVMDEKGYGYWEPIEERHVADLVAALRGAGWRVEEE